MTGLSASGRMCSCLWLFILLLLSAIFFNTVAVTVTVDADGGAGYTSLDAVLSAIQNESIDPDTVLFIGDDQDTYIWSVYVSVAIGTITFRGLQTNPDLFPVVNRTNQGTYNFFDLTSAIFEKVVITGSQGFNMGQTSLTHIFRQCVFRNNTSTVSDPYVIGIQGSVNLILENCLFEGNTSTNVIYLNPYNTSPIVTITNCTFDNNASVFNSDPSSNITNYSFKNNIFSNNTITFRGNNLRGKTTYSLTSEDTTFYGAGCVSNPDPVYMTETPSIPSDWKPQTSSPASQIGTVSGAPLVDIAGDPRGALIDAGCFLILAAGPPVIKSEPQDTTLAEGGTATFSLVAVGLEPLSYAWFTTDNTVEAIANVASFSITVSPPDNGTAFFCIVSNDSGTITSDTVLLTVISKPIITSHPSDTVLFEGETATFSVEATGDALSYLWLRNDTPIAETSPVLNVPGTLANNNATFKCVASNIAGTDTSSGAVLTVTAAAPGILEQPEDVTVFEGNPVSFTIAGSGMPPLAFTWYRVGSGVSVGTGTTYSIDEAQLSDSGASFYCVVSNDSGEVISDEARLFVNAAISPVVTTQPADVIVRETQNATFSLVASGSEPLLYAWYKKGSNEILSTEPTLVLNSVALTDGGSYFCTVSNFYGEGTSRIATLQVMGINEVFNPLVISGQFIDRNHISLTIDNFSGLSSAQGDFPYADSIGIWYKAGEFTAVPNWGATNLIKISLAQLFNSGSDSYNIIVALNEGPLECFSYFFSGSVLWRNPDTIPAFVAANGFSTFMCSQEPISNPLSLTSTYTPGDDSLVLHIINLGFLNRDSIAYLVTWYGDENIGFVYDTIYPENLPEAEFVKTYNDLLFTGESKLLDWRVAFRGILGNYSDTTLRTFALGVPRPINNAELLLGKVNPTQIELLWSFPPTDLNDSVRIWYGTEEIPLQYEIDGTKFNSVSLSSIETTTIIKSLSPSTDYYFGLQVHRNGLWSYITEVSSKSTKTTVLIDTVFIPNTINLTSLSFDALTNKIGVEWTLDTNGMGGLNLEAGIVWSTSTYPKNEPSAVMGQTEPSIAGTNILSLDLGQALVFDTLYYFVIWLRKEDGQWSAPTDSSKDTLRIPAATWQGISYFQGADTSVTALNRSVILKKGPNWSSGVGTIHDTIDVVTPVGLPLGFIPVSKAINFRYDYNSPALYLGMRYDFLPASYTLSDIFIYQYNVSDNNWKVVQSEVDNVNGFVFSLLKLSENRGTFMLMIDTLEPYVHIIADTVSAVLASQNVQMNTAVFDNIANLSIQLWGGKGADTLSLINSKTAISYSDTGIYTIPSQFITEDNGVRAFLVISDGRHTRKIDVSRNVIRTASDPVASEEESWLPVAPTADLNFMSVESVLDELGVDGLWNYDSTMFRICRWVSHDGNVLSQEKWVEYSLDPQIQPLFDFVPGKVIWIKTRNSLTFNMGGGSTVSLKEPYEVSLKANEWTDFALPFKFSIRIGDILLQTGLDPSENDSIWFYNWKWNDEKKRLCPSPLFVPVIPDVNHPGRDLEYKSREAFTIYNNLDRDIILKIPPTPVSMSQYPSALAKTGASSGWSVALKAKTSDEDITPVYCGYTPGKGNTLLPVSPSFGKVRIFVQDKASGRLGGHLITHESTIDGYAFPLIFENNSKHPVKIDYLIDKGRYFPSHMKAVIYNPSSGNQETGLPLQLSSGQKEYRYLLAGDSNYVSNWTANLKMHDFSLMKLYPNPCRENLLIRFSVPYNGIHEIRLTIYDQLGRKVWYRELGHELRPGINSVLWDPQHRGLLSAGTYILRLSAYNAKGKFTGSAQSTIMYIP